MHKRSPTRARALSVKDLLACCARLVLLAVVQYSIGHIEGESIGEVCRVRGVREQHSLLSASVLYVEPFPHSKKHKREREGGREGEIDRYRQGETERGRDRETGSTCDAEKEHREPKLYYRVYKVHGCTFSYRGKFRHIGTVRSVRYRAFLS